MFRVLGAKSMSIARNLMIIQDNIRAAAHQSGRSPAEIRLVAVSKTVDREMIDAAYAAGVRDFGENRVQDMRKKFEAPVGPDATIHLIGHVQTNKARDAVRYCDIVESVDRKSLIEALERRCEIEGSNLDVLLQVNIAGEEQKHGCSPDDADRLACLISDQPHLNLRGLMTIAPLVDDAEQVRPVFRQLRELRDTLQSNHPEWQLEQLSMGMTNDYWVAIEEGATMVRLGRAVFEG
jgi:PLP dependent protein